MVAEVLLDAIDELTFLRGTYISHILVLPEAVPPVTPMNNGFFIRSNFSAVPF